MTESNRLKGIKNASKKQLVNLVVEPRRAHLVDRLLPCVDLTCHMVQCSDLLPESITKLEGQSVSVSNYAGGDKVGATWTDKIMALKRDDSPSQDNAGVGNDDGHDDDEWVWLV